MSKPITVPAYLAGAYLFVPGNRYETLIQIYFELVESGQYNGECECPAHVMSTCADFVLKLVEEYGDDWHLFFNEWYQPRAKKIGEVNIYSKKPDAQRTLN